MYAHSYIKFVHYFFLLNKLHNAFPHCTIFQYGFTTWYWPFHCCDRVYSMYINHATVAVVKYTQFGICAIISIIIWSRSIWFLLHSVVYYSYYIVHFFQYWKQLTNVDTFVCYLHLHNLAFLCMALLLLVVLICLSYV